MPGDGQRFGDRIGDATLLLHLDLCGGDSLPGTFDEC